MMQPESETKSPEPDADYPSRIRGGYLGYPTIETLNRKANEKADAERKIRYFRKLIIRLDGDIGDRELTLRERCLHSEPDDLAERQLEIDRLRHLRGHASALLDFIEDDPLEDSGIVVNENDDTSEPSYIQEPFSDASLPSDDDLLTVEELSNLRRKSRSTIYK